MTTQTNKTLEENIKDIQGRMKKVDARIKQNSEDIEATRLRIEKMEGVPETLQAKYGELREKRQEALALGKDVVKINSALNEIRIELETKEDELIGLQKRLAALQEESRSLEIEKNETYIEIPRIKLIHLKDIYNEAAAKFAQIVIEIQEQRYLLGDSNAGRIVFCPIGFDSGAFDQIPKLFLTGEEYPNEEHRNERVFYNKRWIGEYRVRQAREELNQKFS